MSTDAPRRLFTFHHAGGGPAAFAGWQRRLGPGVTVLPVRLPRPDPDRSRRGPADFRELIDLLNAELDPLLRTPYMFYGHSLGALVSYRLALRRQADGRPVPTRLIVGAHPAPGHRRRLGHIDRLSDESLVRLLAGLDPSSISVMDGAVLGRLAQRVRHDLRLGETCPRPEPIDRLDSPIHVFVGDRDPLMTPADATTWRGHTSVGGTVHVVPGGHFFPRESRAHFLGLLATLVAA